MLAQYYIRGKELIIASPEYKNVIEKMGFIETQFTRADSIDYWLAVGEAPLETAMIFRSANQSHQLPDRFICASETLHCYEDEQLQKQLGLYFKLMKLASEGDITLENFEDCLFPIQFSTNPLSIGNNDNTAPLEDNSTRQPILYFWSEDEVRPWENNFAFTAHNKEIQLSGHGAYSYVLTEDQLNAIEKSLQNSNEVKLSIFNDHLQALLKPKDLNQPKKLVKRLYDDLVELWSYSEEIGAQLWATVKAANIQPLSNKLILETSPVFANVSSKSSSQFVGALPIKYKLTGGNRLQLVIGLYGVLTPSSPPKVIANQDNIEIENISILNSYISLELKLKALEIFEQQPTISCCFLQEENELRVLLNNLGI